MKKLLLGLALAVGLTACGVKEPSHAGAPAAPADSGSWFMPALLGFMAGNMMSRPAAPAPQAPVVINRQVIVKQAPAPAAPTVKPPAPTTAPKSIPAPAPVAKPSYSGPSGYSSIRQSAPTYSRPSFSSGRR